MSQRRFRKLNLDSRFATGGLGSDISFELPQQIITSRGDGVCVTGLSMANVYKTVNYGWNDLLYYRTSGPDPDWPATHTYNPTGNWFCATACSRHSTMGQASRRRCSTPSCNRAVEIPIPR